MQVPRNTSSEGVEEPPGHWMETCRFMLRVSGGSCTKPGSQGESNSESPNIIVTKTQKLTKTICLPTLTVNEFRILSVLGIILQYNFILSSHELILNLKYVSLYTCFIL